MKILIVSDNVAPYRMEWAEELAKKHQIIMAYYKNHDAERNDRWLVRESKNVKLMKLPAIIWNNYSISFSYEACYKKTNPDIVIFDGYGIIPNILGIMYMNCHKKRFYINVDGIVLNSKDNCIKHFLKKMMFSANAYFLCGSDFTGNYIRKFGVDEDHVISHGFSSLHDRDIISQVPSYAERNNMKRQLGLKETTTLLAVGRFLKLKQFDVVIEAFRQFDFRYQLVIIGEGPEKEVYEELIKKYKLNNVRIIDFQPIHELKNYYFASDFFVLSSYSEVWGLVINEAMGYGALPIIASDRCVAGYSLIKNQGTGFQYNYNQIGELVHYMDILFKDDSLRKKMSSNSLKLIKSYTVENMAHKHLEWFEQLRNI